MIIQLHFIYFNVFYKSESRYSCQGLCRDDLTILAKYVTICFVIALVNSQYNNNGHPYFSAFEGDVYGNRKIPHSELTMTGKQMTVQVHLTYFNVFYKYEVCAVTQTFWRKVV